MAIIFLCYPTKKGDLLSSISGFVVRYFSHAQRQYVTGVDILKAGINSVEHQEFIQKLTAAQSGEAK